MCIRDRASSTQFEDWEQINLETWRAMTELYKAGRIKAIGVCNFLPHHLKALKELVAKEAQAKEEK